MTTTAFDDQFTVGTQTVQRVPVVTDSAAILGVNVAALKLELQRQRERADAAEQELKAARERTPDYWASSESIALDGQVLVASKNRNQYGDPTVTVPMWLSPIPAPAVPAEWREFVESVPDYLSNYRDKHDHYGPVLLKEQARALLQSAAAKESATPAPDCRTCANRGMVNGLSQETYCDGCVWYGAYWKKNHYKPLPEPAP